MNKMVIKPFNVIDQSHLPEVPVDKFPTDGDPLEIEGEMYYVCRDVLNQKSDTRVIGVIPLVVRNPSRVSNINEYIRCLTIAHRRVQFIDKKGGCCDLDSCDEMIIT
jgi:hypothetical protein